MQGCSFTFQNQFEGKRFLINKVGLHLHHGFNHMQVARSNDSTKSGQKEFGGKREGCSQLYQQTGTETQPGVGKISSLPTRASVLFLLPHHLRNDFSSCCHLCYSSKKPAPLFPLFKEIRGIQKKPQQLVTLLRICKEA